MKKKSILSVLLALVMVLSTITTPAMAAAKPSTYTFNGGYIYEAEEGKPGTIQIKVSNITKKKSVKLDDKALLAYVDDETVTDSVISYTYDGEPITIKDIISVHNDNGGVTTYYAENTSVTVTSKSALSCFYFSYKGTEVKAKFTPKYYSFDDYLSNPGKVKVLKEQPKGDYLFAPGTSAKLNKPGKYLFVLKDDGLIDESPVSVFCIIITK